MIAMILSEGIELAYYLAKATGLTLYGAYKLYYGEPESEGEKRIEEENDRLKKRLQQLEERLQGLEDKEKMLEQMMKEDT